METRAKTTVLLEGGAFLEGPRRREGKLWFSDMHALRVMTVDLAGNGELVVEVSNRPSGLGWLPDGRLLVVSMTDRKLLCLDPDGLVEHADLSRFARHECNDMAIDRHGRAYVGHFGFDHFSRADPEPASLVLVETDGTARVVAEELTFPNGIVITEDGRTLVVAESWGRRLAAFDIVSGGSLARRRVWADLGMTPDGLCLDAEGCIWVASSTARAVVRVREGGAIEERIDVARRAIACTLGGPDRRTLFVLTSETTTPDKAFAMRSARIETVVVSIPGAGIP